MVKLIVLIGIIGTVAFWSPTNAEAGVTQLATPGELAGSTTTIDFDGVPARTIANSLFSNQGIGFARDDGYAIPIYDWSELGRTTSSAPHVIATISGTFQGTPVPTYVTHLNVVFASPTFELGAYFGNDQGAGSFSEIGLSVFDESGSLLGSVSVTANGNTNVDQFIGLRSDTAFHSARFENIGSSRYSVVLDDVIFSFGGIEVALDIHPNSCPNSLGVNSRGVIPVAVLGTADLDVTNIDPSTVLLEGVSPRRLSVEDVGTPFVGDWCGCTEEGSDGFADLALKFMAPAVIHALGPLTGREVSLTLTGNLIDGTPFHATDCVVIRGLIEGNDRDRENGNLGKGFLNSSWGQIKTLYR